MNFYEKVVLKGIDEFKNLTKAEKEKDLILFKHVYLSMWLSGIFISPTASITVCVFLIAFFIANIVLNGMLSGIGTCLLIPLIGAEFVFLYKVEIKKQTLPEVLKWLAEKIRNLWLLNFKVISFNDWITIRKRYKLLYQKLRSEECNHKCYDTTYALANTLQSPAIKILWMYIETGNHKVGHAVIAKNKNIYDSNLRRTYSREQYINAFNAEIFREYSLDEYFDEENLPKSCFTHLDWEEFGKWCKEHNVSRNN